MGAVKKLLNRPDIFSYFDYQMFLRDWFDYLKTTSDNVSLHSIAIKSGISRSNLSMVLLGETPLSDKVHNALEGNIGLNTNEHTFLGYLVNLTEAKTLGEQKKAYVKITKFKYYKAKNIDGIEYHKYLSKWYYVAIRELSFLPEFQANANWIQKRLEVNVPLTDIREALKYLVKIGDIKIDGKGPAEADQFIHKCEGSYLKLALIDFYRQIYDLGINSMYTTERNEREFKSNTLALSQEAFQEVKALAQEFIDKTHKITLRDEEKKRKDKRIYNLSVISFPFTKRGVSK